MSKRASTSLGSQREMAWRNRLARFAASKLTVEAFCRREAVPVGTFYGWQARLRTREGNVGALPQRVVALSPSPFLDLGPVNGLASRATSPVRDHAPHHVQSSLDVRLDLERALRVIPMGKKNWMFCWTELGAKHVGIVQSLLVTCRLHDIDAYDYFVDVLQRVGQHPASLVHQLTPRPWKQLFADNPLRSDLYDLTTRRNNAG